MAQYADPSIAARAKVMSTTIRRYFDGCNEADVDKMVECFTPDAIHYFPPGMYEGPFRGAQKIAQRWCAAVQQWGSYWSVDRLVAEPFTWQAVLEWTHFKTKQNTILRGIEWYEFAPQSGRICEIRAYYASPQAAGYERLELGGFDYAGRNYPITPPPRVR